MKERKNIHFHKTHKSTIMKTETIKNLHTQVGVKPSLTQHYTDLGNIDIFEMISMFIYYV